MVTEMQEFLDAYSDDIIYLQEGRLALLTHPFKGEIKDLCDPSFCRMFSIIMIGSIETILQEWKDRDKLGILSAYFAEGVSNGGRVQSLYDAFQKAGIKAEREIFDDYLAIKYLRNVIVHANWKPYEKEWLEKRGFPTDTRKLREEHWKRMQSVNQNVMLYIALTSIANPPKNPSDTITKLSVEAKQDDLGLVRKQDIPHIFWRNMEKISECIQEDLEKIVITEDYYWANGFSEDAIKRMSNDETKRLFFLAARKAGQDGVYPFVQHRDLAIEALDSWREYWRLTFDQVGISYEAMTKSIDVLRNLHQRGIYPKGPFFPWPEDITPEIMSKLIQGALEGYEPLKEEQIAFALNIGSKVNNIMTNITALYLLTVQLPIIYPEKTSTYLQEGEKALVAMEIQNYWYSYVELRNVPDVQRWAFYRQIREEFQRK